MTVAGRRDASPRRAELRDAMSEELPAGADLPVVLRALCDGAIPAIGITGASVTVGDSTGAGELMYATDEVAAGLADLELTVGSGPGIRAVQEGRPVLVPDVMGAADGQLGAAGPAFHERARGLGVHAVFAFPLQLGAVRLGVLYLYRDQRGELGEEGFRRSIALADRLTHALLGLWAGNDENTRLQGSKALSRASVHQATGMLMVQLGTGIDEAFARLRAYAFAEGLPLKEVADDIVAQRLRLAHHEEDR